MDERMSSDNKQSINLASTIGGRGGEIWPEEKEAGFSRAGKSLEQANVGNDAIISL